MSGTIKIDKKDSARDRDGYKTFSIRIKEETVTGQFMRKSKT
jgi:hypothetical protein